MGAVCITSSNPKFNGSHFALPPSSINRMTGWVANSRILWRMRTAPIVNMHGFHILNSVHSEKTHKKTHAIKLCIKPRLMCTFSTFWFGFYLSAAKKNASGLQNPQSSLARCDVYSESETWLCDVTNLFQYVNKHFGMQQAVEFSPSRMILGRQFWAAASIWVRLLCNLSLEKVRLVFDCGF